MLTKRSLVEQIQRLLEGALPSTTDSAFTFNYVLSFVNSAIATLAKQSALENSNLEGCTYASDEFNVKYTGVTLTKDINGEYSALLPQMPIGLPKGRGLVKVAPGNNSKSVAFKPISTKDIDLVLSRPEIHNKAYYYLSNGKVWFISCKALFPKTVDITMVASGVNDLDENLLIPEDAQSAIVDIVFNKLIRREGQDLTNDGAALDSNGAR